jgi:Zn-dependent peptidase ImmA (M78 family)
MEFSRKNLARQALIRALEIRQKLNIPTHYPLDIYSVCEQLNVTVQFINIPSGEGIYWREDSEERIFISAQRPLPRRAFTCGHELGHHLFNHGSTMDELEESTGRSQFDPQEFLADCFSGFLLMPKLAVESAFSSRSWTPATATPLQIFTIACSFGVGYNTLIDHMAYSLQLIMQAKAKELKKSNPKIIRQELLGKPSANSLMIVDKEWLLKTIDVEVGYQLLLPKTVQFEGDAISFQADLEQGQLFGANRQGIVRVHCSKSDWSAFIRVARSEYKGFSQYRHSEESDDE